MKQTKNIEILAPAGSFESLRAAIQAGADAVYFGVEQLNMRAPSSYNFSTAVELTPCRTMKATN